MATAIDAVTGEEVEVPDEVQITVDPAEFVNFVLIGFQAVKNGLVIGAASGVHPSPEVVAEFQDLARYAQELVDRAEDAALGAVGIDAEARRAELRTTGRQFSNRWVDEQRRDDEPSTGQYL